LSFPGKRSGKDLPAQGRGEACGKDIEKETGFSGKYSLIEKRVCGSGRRKGETCRPFVEYM
jgi:hypothetical protein